VPSGGHSGRPRARLPAGEPRRSAVRGPPRRSHPDQFLSADGREIVCYAHGAHFSIDSGECIAGVCVGAFLIPVPARVDNGMILIPLELPQTPE
jgi:hypothetical protein